MLLFIDLFLPARAKTTAAYPTEILPELWVWTTAWVINYVGLDYPL
jgi:hypothetical protein